MDVHPDKTSGLGLPQPSTDQGASFTVSPDGRHGREIRPVTMQAPTLQTPTALASLGPQAAALAPPVDANASSGVGTASANDDNLDVLDEEWVNKAKAIVERTKSDPYVESKELSRAKADYLRIRYNKQLKIAEEP